MLLLSASCCFFSPQVTIYHLLKLFQSETDVMLGKKSLVVEYYDEMVRELKMLIMF